MKISKAYSDEEVVEALKGGGPRAGRCIKHLYKSQLRFAVAYVKQNSGTRREGEDVFQDAVIALYEQVLAGSFRGESSVNTYLMQILRNKWLNVVKRKQVHERAVQNVPDETNLSLEKERKVKKAARVLLSKAGKDCQKVLALVFFYKYSMDEVAEFAGYKNAQNARNKKLKCLKKIKKWIHESGEFADLLKSYMYE